MKEEEQVLEAAEYKRLARSPIYFLRRVWNLTPQPIRDPYYQRLKLGLLLKGKDWDAFAATVRPEWFGPFEEDKHITWQQYLVLAGIEKAIRGEASWRFSIVSGHGIGKCLGFGTKVLMIDGSVREVQDIKKGDVLMGDDSTARTVLSLARGREQMYRIKYFDGTYYDVNESHVLSLVASQSHGKQKKGDITNVSVREYLTWSERKRRTNIGYKRPMELPEKKLLIPPYLLGLWLGDGNSRSARIYNIDPEIIGYLRTFGLVSETADKRTKCWQGTVKGLQKQLRAIGLLGNKNIPQEYLTSSRAQRLELLAGIIDTDGSLERTKRQFSIIQKNKKLAEQIKWLAQSVGTHATINPTMKAASNGSGVKKMYYVVSISRNTEIIPTKVIRKQAARSGREQRDALHFGFTVEPLGEGDYYGFEISGNKLFMLGDFTVTHNTALLSWVILWFLFTHPMAKQATTSPSKEQMYDVLWSELKKWIDKMPIMIRQFYIWETQHVRMREAPQEWFARAKTSSKENTEALAGIHGPWVCAAADEASGVEEPIFETMDGSLTGEHIMVFLISNGTRNIGYFYDTHHRKSAAWQCYSFSAIDSPRVTESSIQKWKDDYGEESVQYAVRVLGRFPDEGQVDDKGFVQLLNENDLRFTRFDPEWRPVGRVIGALDASGEGQDTTEWAARNRQIAAILHSEKTSNDKGMAATSITLCDKFCIDPIDFVIDAFGVGHKVAQEIALMTSQEKRPWRVTPLNVGEACDSDDDKEFYVNKRAEMYYKMMLWVRGGGSFMECPTPEETKRLKEELLSIRFKRTHSGRIQIMDKVQMRKLGIKSPNKADAIAMTFLRPDGAKRSRWGDPVSVTGQTYQQFDPYSPLGD